MTSTTARRRVTTSSTAPSTPRLRLGPTGADRTVLDGGWWPRSTDPVAEIPGLVLAIDDRHGPISRLILSAAGWDDQPQRIGLAGGRLLRLGYFTSQPADLLTAICADGGRVDLLVVPPDTAEDTAEAAMTIAATVDNAVRAQDIVLSAGTPTPSAAEGGHAVTRIARRVRDALPTPATPTSRRGDSR